eukprot:scaffold10206_cov100-Isochrysis_galbana.AAC.5
MRSARGPYDKTPSHPSDHITTDTHLSPPPFPLRASNAAASAKVQLKVVMPPFVICHGRILLLARVGGDTAPTGSLPRHPCT